MKKYLSIALIGLVTTLGIFSGCSDEDFSSKYADPSKISTPTCDKLMTGAFYTCRTWMQPGRGFGWLNGYVGKFGQVMGFVNISGRYNADSYGKPDGHWESFYESLKNLRLMENMYSKMNDKDKAENRIFIVATQLFIYQQLAEVSSAWGDMPYTEAATLVITGDIHKSEPKYNTQEELYKLMLDDLKTLSDELANMNLLEASETKFKTQDFINGGDMMKWRMYANSLRLRLAVRLATNQNNLNAQAKTAITEILGSPDKYPVPTTRENEIAYYMVAPDNEFGDLGLGDATRVQGKASHMHLTNLTRTNDPRLPVMYEPAVVDGVYRGFDPSKESKYVVTGIEIDKYYSSVDSCSFRSGSNLAMPAPIFTAPEMWFLKAEAYNEGWASGDAKEAFQKGVALSIEMYYKIHLGDRPSGTTPYSGGFDVPKPANEDEWNTLRTQWAAFADNLWDNIGTGSNYYADKREAIATQKWLHLGFLQETEAWSEVRRTGLPRLTFASDPGSATCPDVPERIRYTENERRYNPNAPKANDDSYFTSLYWAKPAGTWYNKISESQLTETD